MSSLSVYLSGKWTDDELIQNMFNDLGNAGIQYYDWVCDTHREKNVDDQDLLIKYFIDKSQAFVFVISDPSYQYNATRIQFGYALLTGKRCIIVNASAQCPSQCMYKNRSNLHVVSSWGECMELLVRWKNQRDAEIEKNQRDVVNRQHNSEYYIGC